MGRNSNKQQWHQEQRLEEEEKVKEELAAESPEPRDSSQERHSEIPFSESPSQPSEDWQEEVESRESPLTSMRRPEPFSDHSSRTSSETPLSTLNTPRERPSLPSTLSTLSRDKEELSTDSVDEHAFTSDCDKSVD